MGDIYATAAMVLACVGPADTSSDEVRDALVDLDAALQPVLESTCRRVLVKFRQPLCPRI
jgi:hypothetical protein